MPNTHATLGSLFTDIADSIRAKTGTSAEIVADNFPNAIDAMEVATTADNGKVVVDGEIAEQTSRTVYGSGIYDTTTNNQLVVRGVSEDIIFGFHVNGDEGDPEAAVTYIENAVGMTPAKMDYEHDTFDYGSWGTDVFFMPRPCMLKFNGEVDYYLDPSDYSKKEDGTASDIASDAYGGNAMMEWGRYGRKIWYKIVPDSGVTKSASVYVANYQADTDYRCWSFINANGDAVDHFYTPIYEGSIVGTKLRSLSGKANTALCQNKTAAQEVALAEANNPASDKLWFTETLADITLIDLLLILMSKSLDAQTAFGNGRQGQTSAASSMLGTGTMNTKGLFWGDDDDTHGVKVFGMENFWGNQWRRYAGHVMVSYVHKVKYTRGTQDGSTATDYNTDGTGYLSAGAAPQTNDFVKTMRFDANGFVTASVGGTSATYWCDYWYQNSGTRYARRGGACDSTAGYVGPFYVNLSLAPSYASWPIGAAVSCKPLS